MKKSQVSKKELLAFRDACEKNGYPSPDFEKIRTEDVVVNDAEGNPIFQITTEGKLVKAEKASKEKRIVPIDVSKRLPSTITVDNLRSKEYYYAPISLEKLLARENAVEVALLRHFALDPAEVEKVQVEVLLPETMHKIVKVKRKKAQRESCRKKRRKSVEY